MDWYQVQRKIIGVSEMWEKAEQCIIGHWPIVPLVSHRFIINDYISKTLCKLKHLRLRLFFDVSFSTPPWWLMMSVVWMVSAVWASDGWYKSPSITCWQSGRGKRDSVNFVYDKWRKHCFNTIHFSWNSTSNIFNLTDYWKRVFFLTHDWIQT